MQHPRLPLHVSPFTTSLLQAPWLIEVTRSTNAISKGISLEEGAHCGVQVQAGKKPGVLYLKDQSTGYVFTLSIPVDQQASLVSVITRA